MQLDLENKSFVIFGNKYEGKSKWAEYLLTAWGDQAIVYDTLSEYADGPFDSYRPSDRQSVEEYERIIRAIMDSRRYRMLIIDESNRFNPSKPARLPQATADLNDWHRHPEYNLAVGHVCRRPVQLNQDITELSHFMVIFQLPGKNDFQFLNDISYLNSKASGLGDAVTQLPKYHYSKTFNYI